MTRSLRLFVLCAATAACAITAAAASAALPTLSLPTLTTLPTLPTLSLLGGSSANCGATTTPFARWGDLRSYYLAANGGFESGSSGWALAGGAKVVSGNEPFYVHSSADTSSLLLPNGGAAVSSPICFGVGDSGLRFFASGSGTLHVQIIASGPLGSLSVLDGGTTQVSSSWAPTVLFSTLGSQLSAPTGTNTIVVVLTATGNVQVDDLYIDPWLGK